eukprot:Unigene590_Nuclearia_a/m.1895 Unigene590_Nuclearia_a/g.1895  ORF Unigene590_Nuclearia_a/g.1895 Unigene590_Nuclearia_a/m.1895 type:complete len:328 (-) Unigene590_Nuclearia_a:10-993(-)
MWRMRSSSPHASLTSLSSIGKTKYATRFLLRPMSHRMVMFSRVCVSLSLRSWSASILTSGPKRFWYWNASSYCSGSGAISSSGDGFSRSSSAARGLSFHSSSSLLICAAVRWRARCISCLLGSFTSHDRNARLSIRGVHWFTSQLMSRLPGVLAHGTRHSRTTTDSDLAGMKPSRNTFLLPQRKHSSTVSPSGPSWCSETSLCLDRTRWLMMCAPPVFWLELQNHFLHTLQRATHAGLCTAQYLHAHSGSSRGTAERSTPSSSVSSKLSCDRSDCTLDTSSRCELNALGASASSAWLCDGIVSSLNSYSLPCVAARKSKSMVAASRT